MLSVKVLEHKCDLLEREWNSKEKLLDQLIKRKYKKFGMSKWHEDVERIYKEMNDTGIIDYSKVPDIPANAGHLLCKNEIEYAILELEIENLDKDCSKLFKKINTTLRLNRANTTFTPLHL